MRFDGGGFGPGFLRADANGTFMFPLQTSRPLGVITVSGYEDVDEDQTQDPGEPAFSASAPGPCAEPPVPGGSVSGSIDIVLPPGAPAVHVTIDAQSGPTGQNPTGTVRIGTATTGTVTCVSVKGRLATIGVRFEPALPGGVTAALIDVIDYEGFAVPSDDLMSFEAMPSAPTQCPYPISASGFLLSTNGDFTVTPAPSAPPQPTSKAQCQRAVTSPSASRTSGSAWRSSSEDPSPDAWRPDHAAGAAAPGPARRRASRVMSP